VTYTKEPYINTLLPGIRATRPTRRSQPPAASRPDDLRVALLAAVEMLCRRRADLIGDGVISDYVALNWLEWNGGALRLTVTGQNICEQVKAETPESVDA
jgi:hypothetical protein